VGPVCRPNQYEPDKARLNAALSGADSRNVLWVSSGWRHVLWVGCRYKERTLGRCRLKERSLGGGDSRNVLLGE
jgi:hypothetical protein